MEITGEDENPRLKSDESGFRADGGKSSKISAVKSSVQYIEENECEDDPTAIEQ